MSSEPVAPAAAGQPALLAEITAEVAAGTDLRALLERFLQPLVQLAGARAGAVRMLSDDGTRFELVGSLGLPPALEQAERRVDRHCGFCGLAAGENAPVVWTRDLAACSARTGEAFFGSSCRCALAVPLRHGERVLGIYNLFLPDEAEPPAAVLQLLRSAGELLGLALEKHRLEAENLRARVARERQLLAADLHDSVAQNLTFVKMRLPLLGDAIEAGKQESAMAFLEDIRATLDDAHGSLRQIVTHFRTGVDPRRPAPSLASLAGRFTLRTGIPVQLDDCAAVLRLTEEDQGELFHIVQEALANVERHAHAQHVWLGVRRGPSGVEIRVEDDGVGTGSAQEAAAGSDHYGLDIMRERARRIGGLLTVGPRPGGGTAVCCALPLAGQGDK